MPDTIGWRERGRALLPKDVTAVFGKTPAIILVEPQLEENIGAAARAMGNCALGDLRLVNPRPDHLTDRARAASAGADAVLEQARVFGTLTEAVADLVHVYAATARRRDLMKRLMTPLSAAAEMRAFLSEDPVVEPCGVLFGRERTGLGNDDVALSQAVIEIPLNPWFCSLNLAQAVLLVGYEWFARGDRTPALRRAERSSPPATQAALLQFYRHLEEELDDSGFLRLPDKRPGMVRNIRSIFARASLSEQEVRTLHGIVRELRWGRRPDRLKRNSPDDAD